jgi:hypothetical protein
LWVAIELRIVHLEAIFGLSVPADIGLVFSVVWGSRHFVLRSVINQGNRIFRTVIGAEASRVGQTRRHLRADDRSAPIVIGCKYDGGEDVATSVALASFFVETYLHAYGLAQYWLMDNRGHPIGR